MSAVYVVAFDGEPVAAFDERWEAELLASRSGCICECEVFEVEHHASGVGDGSPQG